MADENGPNSNFKEPRGLKGRLVLRAMNKSHGKLTRWALGKLPDHGFESILDIGCGGGNALRLMGFKYPSASLNGVDISEESVRFAMRYNDSAVREGRCSISQASVSSLPFEDGSFDLLTAIETYFFWPSLEDGLTESVRVLAPGGTMMLVSEMYPHPDFKRRNERWTESMGLRLRPVDEIGSIFESLGCDFDTHLVERSNWMCIIARKRR